MRLSDSGDGFKMLRIRIVVTFVTRTKVGKNIRSEQHEEKVNDSHCISF